MKVFKFPEDWNLRAIIYNELAANIDLKYSNTCRDINTTPNYSRSQTGQRMHHHCKNIEKQTTHLTRRSQNTSA
jgi:hypothetical protein